MHSPSFRYLGTSAVACVLLAGCSGGGNTITAPANGGAVAQTFSHSFLDENPLATSTAVTIAVSDPLLRAVDLYNAQGMLISSLTGFTFPYGLSSDIKGNLYVTDSFEGPNGGGDRVLVYAAGFASPPKTLRERPNVDPSVSTALATASMLRPPTKMVASRSSNIRSSSQASRVQT